MVYATAGLWSSLSSANAHLPLLRCFRKSQTTTAVVINRRGIPRPRPKLRDVCGSEDDCWGAPGDCVEAVDRDEDEDDDNKEGKAPALVAVGGDDVIVTLKLLIGSVMLI